MPISEYSIETYENWSDKVVSMLSRFAHVRIESHNVKRLKVFVATESRYADEAWKSLVSDLRGVTNCSLVSRDSEQSELEPILATNEESFMNEPRETALTS